MGNQSNHDAPTRHRRWVATPLPLGSGTPPQEWGEEEHLRLSDSKIAQAFPP